MATSFGFYSNFTCEDFGQLERAQIRFFNLAHDFFLDKVAQMNHKTRVLMPAEHKFGSEKFLRFIIEGPKVESGLIGVFDVRYTNVVMKNSYDLLSRVIASIFPKITN